MYNNAGWGWRLPGYIYFHLRLVAQGDVMASVGMGIFFSGWWSVSPQFLWGCFQRRVATSSISPARGTQQFLSGIDNMTVSLSSHPDSPVLWPSLNSNFLHMNSLKFLEPSAPPSEKHRGWAQDTTIVLRPVLWATQHRSFLWSYLGQKLIWALIFMITFTREL